jgi:hypothetical protein
MRLKPGITYRILSVSYGKAIPLGKLTAIEINQFFNINIHDCR